MKLHSCALHSKARKLPKKEMFHPQLPLGMPCYDFVPVTELSLGPLARDLSYSRLP